MSDVLYWLVNSSGEKITGKTYNLTTIEQLQDLYEAQGVVTQMKMEKVR